MSGDATFAGTNYQGKVIAYVAVHILIQRKLGWFVSTDDLPIAISGETLGAGDDARIELGNNSFFEIQAKHSMNAAADLEEIVQKVQISTSSGENYPIVIVTSSRSTKKLFSNITDDLERLRCGRTDGLSEEIRTLLEKGVSIETLSRIHIQRIDIDLQGDACYKFAVQLLTEQLKESEKSFFALSLLFNDGGEICARKLRRNRKSLVDLLTSSNLFLRPLREYEIYYQRLDFCSDLIKKHQTNVVLSELRELEAKLKTIPCSDNEVFKRCYQLFSSAFFLDHDYLKAENFAVRSLSYDPNNISALANLCHAQLSIGKTDEAEKTAQKAVEMFPLEPKAWGALCWALRFQGKPHVNPPPQILENKEFLILRASLELQYNEFQAVINTSNTLLFDGVRTPEVLLFRSIALYNLSYEDPCKFNDFLIEAENLLTEGIEALEGSFSPVLMRLFSIRHRVRLSLKKSPDAEQDLQVLQKRYSSDLGVIEDAGKAKLKNGEFLEALQILTHPNVKEHPEFLVLKAHALIGLGRKTEAKAIVEELSNCEVISLDNQEIIEAVAEIFIILGEVQKAVELLKHTSATTSQSIFRRILQGRILLKNGNLEEGISELELVAQQFPRAAIDIRLEMAVALLNAKKPNDSVIQFRKINRDEIPKDVERLYIQALIGANLLQDAKDELDKLMGLDSIPLWVMDFSYHIAVKQGDIAAGIRVLEEIIKIDPQNWIAHLQLSQLLASEGKAEEAKSHIDELLKNGNLSLFQKMEFAHLLAECGYWDKAVEFAIRCYREGGRYSRIHRGIISLVLNQSTKIGNAKFIEENTHVQLEDDSGDTTCYFILNAENVDPMKNEITVDSALKLGLIGKAEGEVVIENQGSSLQKCLTIKKIQPSLVGYFQDAIINYEKRFPTEEFFVMGIKIGNDKQPLENAKLISSLVEKKSYVENLIKLYNENILPLGFLSNQLHCNIPEAMERLSLDPTALGLIVEWNSRKIQNDSVSTALETKALIISRSSLHILSKFGILPFIKDCFTLRASLGLKISLKLEKRAILEKLEKGCTTLGMENERMVCQNIPPGDERIRVTLKEIEAQIDFLNKEAILEPRPLELIPEINSTSEEIRKNIGVTDYDSICLAKANSAVLIADDLGLRKIACHMEVPNISSITFLHSILTLGKISRKEHNKILLDLVSARFLFIFPDTELILEAFDRWGSSNKSALQLALDNLALSDETPINSGNIWANVIKANVISPIKTISTKRIVKYALEFMAKRWNPSFAAKIINDLTYDVLFLFPNEQNEVEQACNEFLIEKIRRL